VKREPFKGAMAAAARPAVLETVVLREAMQTLAVAIVHPDLDSLPEIPVALPHAD
jgi:hypothetical protein